MSRGQSAARQGHDVESARPGRAPLPMVHNSIGLIAGKIAQMGAGFFFWALAARLVAPEAVGLAAAAVSAMMLCTQLAVLGVGSAVIVRLPQQRERIDALLDTAVSLVSLSALAVALVFLLIAGTSLQRLHVLATNPANAAIFLLVTLLGTLGILLDQVCVALGRGPQVLTRNVVSGVVMLGSLALLSLLLQPITASQLFGLWALAGVVGTVLGAVQLRAAAHYRFRPVVHRSLWRGLIGVGLPNQALTLSERAPGLVLPLLVTELLSPEANGYWYVVWMMAWVVYIAPISMGMALFAEAARASKDRASASTALPGLVRRALRACLLLTAAGAVGVALLSPFALGLLGSSYASAGTTPLRILLVALLPMSLIQVYYAMCRATGRLAEAVSVGWATGLVGIAACALIGVRYGLTGLATTWLTVQGLAGAWAGLRLRALTTAPADGPPRGGSSEASVAGAVRPRP